MATTVTAKMYRVTKPLGDTLDNDGETLKNWIWDQWDRKDNPSGYVECYTWRGRKSSLVRDEAMYALAGIMNHKNSSGRDREQYQPGDVLTTEEIRKRIKQNEGYHQVNNQALFRAAMDVLKHSGYFEPVGYSWKEDHRTINLPVTTDGDAVEYLRPHLGVDFSIDGTLLRPDGTKIPTKGFNLPGQGD
jgi:hypothetical protein